MNTRLAIIFFFLLVLAVVVSGQRASRSGATPPWLPARDYSPADPLYPLDRLGERVDLRLAAAGDERLDLALIFADEKFHEAIAMVRAEEAGHAWIAVGLHKDYLERAARQLNIEPVAETSARRERYLAALVRQLRVLGDAYPDLPEEIRAFSLIPLVSNTLTLFDDELQHLPAAAQATARQTRTELEVVTARMRALDR